MAKPAGERTKLNKDAVVSSALALADAEGLDAITIRRLAQDHAVTPMALYWHFKNKEQLLDGLAERLFTEVRLPADDNGTWHARLHSTLAALLAALRPHPAVAELAAARIVLSDAGLMVAERVLGLLREAGFSAAEAAETGSQLLCSITTLVAHEPGSGQGDETTRAALNALSPSRYPNVLAAAGPLTACGDPDRYFSRGLDLLVQGTRGVR